MIGYMLIAILGFIVGHLIGGYRAYRDVDNNIIGRLYDRDNSKEEQAND